MKIPKLNNFSIEFVSELVDESRVQWNIRETCKMTKTMEKIVEENRQSDDEKSLLTRLQQSKEI
jgi:hypothetical protein